MTEIIVTILCKYYHNNCAILYTILHYFLHVFRTDFREIYSVIIVAKLRKFYHNNYTIEANLLRYFLHSFYTISNMYFLHNQNIIFVQILLS